MAGLPRSNPPRVIAAADPDAVEIAATLLRAGNVVAIPTDTVYGYAAAIDRHDAIERIYTLKGRPGSKAIPILLSGEDQAGNVAQAMPDAAMALAQAFWPGGLTMVLNARDGLHPHLTSTENGRRTVAIRVPDHPFARGLIAFLGGSLAVTSANRSGERPALDAADIDRETAHAPDAIIDGGRVRGGTASTIVRLSERGFEVLREGAISAAEIGKALAAGRTR